MGAAEKIVSEKPRAKPLLSYPAKTCSRCGRQFPPKRPYQKRCVDCVRPHELERLRERWHRTYVRKGYNQGGAQNNNWKGGTANRTYQNICVAAHGDRCFKCGAEAVLVHHLDEDRENNTVENLRPMCKRCHQLEHDCTANLPKPGSLPPKPCLDCKKDFKPGSGRSLRCSDCRVLHLRAYGQQKRDRKRRAAA